MKESNFRKAYLAFARLYGAIFSSDAFEILKKYFPTLKKSEFNRDLKKRFLKMTRGYAIFYCKRQLYVITKDYFNSDDITETFENHRNKPFYIPDSFEELIKFGNPETYLLTNLEYRDDLQKFIMKHIDEEKTRILDLDIHVNVVTNSIIHQIEFGLDFEYIMNFIENNSVRIEDNELQDFLNIIQKISNATRNIYNCGFTPEEMLKNSGPIDMSKTQFTLGPNITKSFQNGEIDPYEYLEALEKSELSPNVKNSLRKELESIINEIKKGEA